MRRCWPETSPNRTTASVIQRSAGFSRAVQPVWRRLFCRLQPAFSSSRVPLTLSRPLSSAHCQFELLQPIRISARSSSRIKVSVRRLQWGSLGTGRGVAWGRCCRQRYSMWRGDGVVHCLRSGAALFRYICVESQPAALRNAQRDLNSPMSLTSTTLRV